MTDYIVDASVVAQRLIYDVYTPNAVALFQQALGNGDKLYIPEFCKLECVNVIWKQVRFQGMPQSQAEKLVKDLRALKLIQLPVSRQYHEALKVGIKHQLAIYDSIYIALAKQLNYPLITADQKQMQAAAQEHVTVTPLTNFVP